MTSVILLAHYRKDARIIPGQAAAQWYLDQWIPMACQAGIYDREINRAYIDDAGGAQCYVIRVTLATPGKREVLKGWAR